MIRIGRICWTSRHLGDHFIHSPGLYVQSTSNALVMRKCGADLRSASCRHPNISGVSSYFYSYELTQDFRLQTSDLRLPLDPAREY